MRTDLDSMYFQGQALYETIRACVFQNTNASVGRSLWIMLTASISKV
jgi:hypothetical protein